MEQKKLFLLDAYALIFRAYYAFIRAQMINSKGLNTSAVYGFTATLEEILRIEAPTHIAVVFDPPGPTFRHIKFPQYKANRDATPEEIKLSVPWIKKIIQAFNIPIIEVEGYEADDVIGTLAKKAENEGFKVFMMTPDKDFAQLVSENIFMYKPRRSGNDVEILGIDEIKEKFQVENPIQVIDILALWGDSSDNVPGAPGIGEKTAKKLISEYKSVENLFENTSMLKGKQQESIIQNKDQISLSKDLVTIRLDVPVNFDEEHFAYGGGDQSLLANLFNELEFRTLSQRIIGGTKEVKKEKVEHSDQTSLFEDETSQGDLFKSLASIKDSKHKYYCADSQSSRNDLIRELTGKKTFCFDTETTSLNSIEAELVGMSFSWETGLAWYVPVPANKSETLEILESFREIFENNDSIKVGQNLKYDFQVLATYGINVNGGIFDTMIAHYLLQPERKHNLDFLSEVYLGYQKVRTEELIGRKGSLQGNMRDVPQERIKDYACEDADITWQLYELFKEELGSSALSKLADEIEFPLIPVLAAIERNGVSLDSESLNIYSKLLEKDILILRDEIYELAGEEFNIQSPKQLGDILFEKLKISKDARKTKTKQYSTSEEVLSKLAGNHPIVDKVLEFRTLRKLLSTYVEALPKLVNKRTGLIHTTYNQAVAATGRLSSNNPNLQNIPIREERGREIRKSFVPRSENHIFLSADYSQIELRLMAHMSQDPLMMEAFQNGEDIHSATAAKIYGIPADQVSREQRGKAKTANFGIIYGISAYGLSQRLNIPRSEAKELIDNYFSTYSKVQQYMEDSIQNARDKGFVETMLGRRRYLRDINSRNAVVRGFAERNAINAPIQGSAADIIKIAMIKVQEKIFSGRYETKLIMQVHDELILDVVKHELEQIIELVKNCMESAYELSIPLEVDYGTGNNWLEAH
jgi:DNA polymerase I